MPRVLDQVQPTLYCRPDAVALRSRWTATSRSPRCAAIEHRSCQMRLADACLTLHEHHGTRPPMLRHSVSA